MKNYFVFITLLAFLFLQSCKEETPELSFDDENIEANCINSDLIHKIDTKTPLIVRKTNKNFYYYEGHDYYLELDAKKYAPSIYDRSRTDKVNIYVNGNLKEFENQTVLLRGGEIHWCFTGLHGQVTLNPVSFYILKNPVVSNN